MWRRSGGLAVALPGGVALVAADGDAAAAEVVPVAADRPDQQLNDGACDRQGRFWVGTASRQPGTSALYRLDADHRVEQVLPGVTMSNGLGWSPDQRTFYYVDSAAQRLDAFDHDPDSGRLGGRRPLVSVPAEVGIPDGLAVDADGCVWLAIWGAGSIHRYTPAGVLDGILDVPASNVTSCAFGGAGPRRPVRDHRQPGTEPGPAGRTAVRGRDLRGHAGRRRPRAAGLRGLAPPIPSHPHHCDVWSPRDRTDRAAGR